MKHLFSIILTCLVFAMASPSAMGKTVVVKTNPQPTQGKEVRAKVYNADQVDSIKDALQEQVDVLKNELDDEVDNLNEEINKKQPMLSKWSIIGLWVIGAISLILLGFSAFLYIKITELKYINGQLSQIKKKHDKFFSQFNDNSLITEEALKRLNKEIDVINRELTGVKKQSRQLNNNVQAPVPPRFNLSGGGFEIESRPKAENIYFGDVIGDANYRYFAKEMRISSGAIFSATKIGKEAKFAPLGLDTLRGNENARLAIDFGGVITQNAKSMRVDQLGIATLSDDGEWVVKQNAKVTLS